MADEATLTLTLDPDLLDHFVAEAGLTMRPADDVLRGLLERDKPEALAVRGGCWFERGAVKVHLGVEEGFAPARKAHPAFVVDDLAGLAARLAAAGHPSRPDVPLDGCDRLFVDDPFGNRIELMQPRP